MNIKQFETRKSSLKNWREIFQNPRPVTFEIFKTGTVNINRRGSINIKHPDAGYINDEVLNVPIKAYLVHHDELGNFLLDAGLDVLYIDDTHGGLDDDLDEFFLKKNENIKFQLDYRGIKLKAVFLSHLHSDHIAGIRELPKTIPYVVGKGELEQYHPKTSNNFINDVETLYELSFSKSDEIPPLGPCANLLGDGSLWAVSTPGHSKGHISYLINGLDGPVFLTMDACFIKDNLRLKIAPIDYTWDVEMAQKTLDMIIKFLEDYPEVKVIYGH